MEEQEIPDLGTQLAKSNAPENKSIDFVKLASKSIEKGAGIDPLFFSDVLNEYGRQGKKPDLVFSKEQKEKVREKYGDDGLKQWEELYDATLDIHKVSQDKDFYESYASPTMNNKLKGIKNFEKFKDHTWDKQGEFAAGFESQIAIKTPEMIAEKSPSIIDYDPLKGYFNRELKNDSIDSIASFFGENKQLTIATYEVVAQTDPKVKQMIKDGLVDPKAYYKDEEGVYKYRALQKGERPTDNIRSVWGPQTLYHNSYMQEILESMNDFAMDSLDAALYIGQFPQAAFLNATQSGAKLMGIDATWADAWNDTFHDYRNWSQSRRSTKSWEDNHGAFDNFTNFSKGVVQIVGQIVATRGAGLLGGLGAKATSAGMKYLGKSLSDDAARAMMSRTALGYNMMYGASMANEEARKNGLGDTESHAMAVAAGAVMMLTEKLTGGQFTDKIFGPIRSKVYAKRIVEDIAEQAKVLGLTPAQLAKDEKLFGGVIGNVLHKTNKWLTDTAETRLQNTAQGFVGEAFQETMEDGMNMITQEFRDYMAGEDSYDNTWRGALHQLSESFVLGGIGGAFGGAAFFNKKNWEMSYVDESKFDWITAAALKGELKDVRRALEDSRKKGTLGSTLYSAMQNDGVGSTPMSLENDPVAISQNDLLYKQFTAQINLVEEMAKKYEAFYPKKEELGNFIMGVTGGKAFVDSDDFANIEKNTAHMMQREAVAFEIKRNHAKNMLALELAKAAGTVDLSQIETIHAFKGKVLSIQQAGKTTPEMPNTITKNALEEALRQVEDNGDQIKDVRKEYAELYLKDQALKEAEYNLNKNPMNTDFVDAHTIAQEEFDKQSVLYEKALADAKLTDTATELLVDLNNFDNLEKDFRTEERKRFYTQKAILEMTKIEYAQFLSNHKGMSVYDFRMKEKDKEFFNNSIVFEDQKRADVAAQYEGLIASISTLDGTALEDKIMEMISLQKSTGMLFVSPASKQIIDQKIAELVLGNKFQTATDLSMVGLRAGEDITEEKLAKMLRIALIAAELNKETIDPDRLNELLSYKAANMPLQDADMELQGYMKDASLDVLLDEFNSRYQEILDAIPVLQSQGLDFSQFNLQEIQNFTGLMLTDAYQQYEAGQHTLNQLKAFNTFTSNKPWVDTVKDEMARYFHSKGIDFSTWQGEDLEMLARAMNMNGTRNDMAGGSIISKIEELEREQQKNPDEFTEVQTLEALRKELIENAMEVILQHKMNDWGLENGSEKFKNLLLAMTMLNSVIAKLYQAAQANMNKRSGRDYKIKQDYINFHSKALIQLDQMIGAMSPEDLSLLSSMLFESPESFNEQQKKDVDDRLEKLIDLEEKMSNAVQEEVKKEGRAKEILDAMNMVLPELFVFNGTGQLTRSAFRDLHEDIDSPYNPINEASAKEQFFNFMVQLERGNIRTFFNRFNEILDEAKATSQLLPSFEQALSARQLFGFLIDQKSSAFKDAINAQIDPRSDGKVVMDNHQIFVRGIAGAGKSSFVTKLAFELFGTEMSKIGLSKKAVFSAPNQSQIDNIGETMESASGSGLVATAFDLPSLYAMSSMDGGILEDVSVIVIDEATLEGTQLSSFMDRLSQHNEAAPEGKKIKLVLIGDEFQNSSNTMYASGIPLFYNWKTDTVMERTVPLTSPYRSGKIESFGLQMNHRKMIAEMNKIQKALNYGLKYKRITTGDVLDVNAGNWRDLAREVFDYYNGAKVFNYFEKKPGIIDFGLQSMSKKEDVMKGFLDKLADSDEKSEVALIVHESDKSEILSELGRMASTFGIPFDAATLAPYVFNSQEIQGLSKAHVFVAIDLQGAIETGADVGTVKSVLQSMYVAESRERESLTVWLPGNHASVKNVSKNSIFSYPKVHPTDTKPDGTSTEQALELQNENKNLVSLIQRLSRPESVDPENNILNVEPEETKSEEVKTETKKKRTSKTKIEETVKTEEEKKERAEQHEKNKFSNAFEKVLEDENFFENAKDDYKTMDDLFDALEKDSDQACNL
jgi:hypothetical protein